MYEFTHREKVVVLLGTGTGALFGLLIAYGFCALDWGTSTTQAERFVGGLYLGVAPGAAMGALTACVGIAVWHAFLFALAIVGNLLTWVIRATASLVKSRAR